MSTTECRKRSKKRFVSGQKKRWRGSRELEVGMKGVLITCNMNQRKCTAEAFNLLNEYADRLYGPEQLQDRPGSSSEEEEEADEEDVAMALKKEVSQLQTSGAKQQRRFQALDSGANNVIFIKTHNLESDQLVHHILSDLHQTKKKKSRVILRMLPVTGTCRAFQDDMLRFMSTFLEPWFKSPNAASYQVAFKARNSSHNKRDDVIKAVAGLVGELNPNNKVDLTNPQLTIIVEVIKAVCCVSVVKDYRLYKKYNVQEVVKDEPPPNNGAEPSAGPLPSNGAEPSAGAEPSNGAEPSAGAEPSNGAEPNDVLAKPESSEQSQSNAEEEVDHEDERGCERAEPETI